MTPPTEQRHSAFLAVVLAALLPGLGHLYLGRRGKAGVFFVAIVGLFVAGWWLGEWRVVSFSNVLLFAGQGLTGGLAFVAAYIGGLLIEASGPPDPVPVTYEMAVLFTLVAGLLNLLVMTDAYILATGFERRTARKEN